MTNKITDDHARQQAIAQVASIAEMIAATRVDYDRLAELREKRDAGELTDDDDREELADLEKDAGDCTDEDDAWQRIDEDPLSVDYRSGWANDPGDFEAEEFRILLCTGGPHVEIQGDIGMHGEPKRPRIIYKDWGTSGELFDFDRESVLAYCERFIGY